MSQTFSPLFTKSDQLKTFEKQAFLNKSKLTEGTLLKINENLLTDFQDAKNTEISFSIPLENGDFLGINLEENNIFSDGFMVTTTDGTKETLYPYEKALHYFGKIEGIDNGFAAFSFFEDQIVGILSYDGANFTLEKVEELSKSGSPAQYIFYKESDFQISHNFECQTPDEFSTIDIALPNGFQLKSEPSTKSSMVNVDVYIECDYQMYMDFSSNVTTTTNYTTGLFNVVAAIYADAGGVGLGPTMVLSQVMVWTSMDPYGATTATTSGPVLEAFQCNTTTYNGRLAHLLSTSSQNLGGLAQLPSCPGTGQYIASIHGFSNIDGVYDPNLNNYSWDIGVLAHELGHNMSSPHTHACFWNGNNTQIDDCGNQWSLNNGNTPEGDACFDSNNPIIPAMGSIMSYCHLNTGNGINLAGGFNTQIGAQINTFAACLSTSIDCQSPGLNTMSTINTTSTSTRLICSLTSNVSFYGWGYKEAASMAGFTVVPTSTTTNYYDLTGLLPNTDYEFFVVLYCTGIGWGSWSCGQSFTTAGTGGACTIGTYMNPCTTGDFIESFTFGSFQNLGTACAFPGANNYSDYTTIGPDVQLGETYNVAINSGSAPQWYGVYIDFDQDGNFAEVGEFFDMGQAPGSTTINMNITIPMTATMGMTTMRVRSSWQGALVLADGCNTQLNYGEIEDYMIDINCPEFLTVSGNIANGFHSADNELTSTGTVQNTYTVIFEAGNGVTLNPEFEVEAGGLFEIIMQGCFNN